MSQDNPLISVIVPVYKVEEYLDQCVDSIVNQTYRNLEIILVDDGSPDKCPGMCDNWAAKDSRIKVVHKKNGGASSARNAGLEFFSGDYVTFVDADDLIAYNLVDKLFRACVDNKVSLSMCALRSFSSEVPVLDVTNNSTVKRFTGKLICKNFFCCYGPNPVAKLFEKATIKDSRFVIGRKMGEDAAFTYPIMFEQEFVAFVSESLYFYRNNVASATGVYSMNQLDELKTLLEMLSFYDERKEYEIYNAMAIEYLARIIAHKHKMKVCHIDDVSALGMLDEKKKQLACRKNLSLKTRALLMLGEVLPDVFRILFFRRQTYLKKRMGRGN